MNATIKTFATFSLSAAVGQILIEDGKTDVGTKLYEAGLHASAVYPSHHLTSMAVEKVGKAVGRLCDETVPYSKVLSMLLASLVDIRAHVKEDRRVYIDPLIERIKIAIIPYTNYELLHTEAYNTYMMWTK